MTTQQKAGVDVLEVLRDDFVDASVTRMHDKDAHAKAARSEDAIAAVAELIDERDAMANWIVRRGQELRDHACAECVVSGDLVVNGWRCAYHTALARVGGAQ